MTHYQTAIEEMVSQQELASLAAENGRCITATVSIPVPAQIRPRINSTVREVEKRLKTTQIDVRTAKMLLEPLHELETSIEASGDWAVTLAVYRSLDTFRCFHVTELPKDVITIGERFQLRPLLSAVSRPQRFSLLALSQKKVRLFVCEAHRMDEVEMRGRVPQNLQSFLSMKAPDHVLDSQSSGGPAVGSMKGVTFGTSSDREKHDEYLAHFFRAIDTGLNGLLDGTPLMLAGVDEEVALYRKINTYKPLVEEDVHGAPDGMSTADLRERAGEVVRRSLAAPLAKIVREFDGYRGARRVALQIAEILARAEEGRVADLLVREDAERRGLWDKFGQRIQESAEGEDLLNVAVVETLGHSGQAFALREDEMPEAVEAAAVLRY